MFTNYLKIALRNILKRKSYSIINITGLAIGMTCFILIALYIQYELSYDKYHENAEQIYRIVMKQPGNYYMGKDVYNVTPAPLAPTLKSEYPEVINAARVKIVFPNPLVQVEQKSFEEERMFYTEPDFLKIFSFPLITGNPQTVLENPYSILLTEEMAHKYFGNTNPVGQKIKLNQSDEYTITGVMKNVPQNSHFVFDFLISLSTLYAQNNVHDNWRNNSYFTYIQLNNNTPLQVFEAKLIDLIKEHKGADNKDEYLVEPLSRIHLYGDRNYEIEHNGDIRYVYLFTAIGFFLLLIACFNYINISTAQSFKRAKEVGLRKVVGANRKQLLQQFLSESLIISFLSFCISVCLVELLMPFFNTFIGNDINLSLFSDIKLLITLLGVLLLVGCLAGAYPAFFITSFQPTKILKGVAKKDSKSFFSLRNVLVISQFIISAVLIVSTITVYKQLHYIKNKNLGYQKDHILTLSLRDTKFQKQYESFISELSNNHYIKKIAASNCLPFDIQNLTGAVWEGKTDEEYFPISELRVDRNFLDLYNISLIEGSNFSEDNRAYILNETTINKLGWDDPIGKRFAVDRKLNDGGPVVGVIKDFHFYSLYNLVEPLALQLIEHNSKKNKKGARFLSIKISSEDIPQTISFIEKKWEQFTQYPFDYQFVDKNLDQMYKAEKRLGDLFNIFAFIAILIGCLGLYGLASNTIEQKIKEIGIRKVLGASVSQIVQMLSKEVFICIIIANLIAGPLTYYFMNNWLQDFAYRIEMSLWMFILSGGIALVIALATVSFQAIKAATANPVEALKYE
ncbi:MAG: ABC transporter permease [Ignavibacteria bacterium]|jgi:putative ABC transport system permease protein